MSQMLPPYASPDNSPAQPYPPVRECITKEALRERERCVLLVWENRGKCASNQAALALMDLINGEI